MCVCVRMRVRARRPRACAHETAHVPMNGRAGVGVCALAGAG